MRASNPSCLDAVPATSSRPAWATLGDATSKFKKIKLKRGLRMSLQGRTLVFAFVF